MPKYVSGLCLAMALVIAALAQAPPKPPPEQPIPYSHKKHVAELKLKCNMCHPNKEPGETMGIPQASTCMQCHASVKTDSPTIQKLAEFAKTKREIRWARIYQIPTYVMFSHKAHLDTGNTCQECHGPVQDREQLFKETDISMGGCMSCHKAKNASNDCSFCHEPR